ncbi:methylated-DNA--[protein]-cysteine S-methyltransferase [Methyloprofundus sp.]|uniref:methylated-DNA--[protein]-cysteine S-methyltransferase n=1 Tax=Methyloprofundus sp. TaxID=2020875 RepID=UPI003D0B0E9A
MYNSSLNWQSPETPQAVQSYYYTTPIGVLAIQMQGTLLSKLYWALAPQAEPQLTHLSGALEQQLNEYWLSGKMIHNSSLLKQGTEFQQKAWNALSRIPLGQTRTYGELANELGTAPRALANACRKNPFPVIIPCHRVLAKTGIGGYAGATSGKLINIKLALLKHEEMMLNEL